MLNNLINIDNVLVNKEILEKKFTCNLDKCKGACCTMESDYGAPLLKEEIDKINEILPKVKKHLSSRQINEIETNGFYFEVDGDLMVSAIDNQDLFLHTITVILQNVQSKKFIITKVQIL